MLRSLVRFQLAPPYDLVKGLVRPSGSWSLHGCPNNFWFQRSHRRRQEFWGRILGPRALPGRPTVWQARGDARYGGFNLAVRGGLVMDGTGSAGGRRQVATSAVIAGTPTRTHPGRQLRSHPAVT